MKLHFTQLLLIAVIVAAAAVVSVGQDAEPGAMVENPEYVSWASFKPGAMAKMKMMVEAAGNTSEMLMTTTLMAVADDEATVEMVTEVTAQGQKMVSPAQERKIPAKVPTPPDPEETPDVETEKGEEEITVAAGTFQCEWAKTTMKQDGSTIVTTVWISPDVPGRTVKMVARTEMEGGFVTTTESELVEFGAGE